MMNVNDFLKKIDCKCGRTHECDIKKVYIEDGAIFKLAKLIKEYDSVLLVADENTFNACGEKVENAIANKIKKKVIFSGKTILIPNEQAIKTVQDNLEGIDLIIAVGSGVMQDLCKCVSFYNKIPYMVVATAPSMDGYASTGAAMILNGMKDTVKAGLPLAILAEPEVLANAPFEMIQAGYGDIIGKYSALNDWKLSSVVNGEYFCNYIYDITYNTIKQVERLADGLKNRDKESVKTLMEALVIVGIMMSFAGSSRPASGSEHHFSHFFEIVGILNDEPYFSHGIDVGYSTVLTAKLRKDLLNIRWTDVQFSDESFRSKELLRVYKTSAKPCEELQEKVGNYKKNRLPIYLEKEEEIRAILLEMPSMEEIANTLLKVGLDYSEFISYYGEDKIKDAVKYAKDLKDRYTFLWMLYDFGYFREDYIDSNKIKIMAFDLDGTLSNHKCPLPKENLETLKNLAKRYKILMVGAGMCNRIFNQMDGFPADIVGNYGLQWAKYNDKTKTIDIIKDFKFDCDRDSVEKRATFIREKYGFTEFKGDSVEYHSSGCITLALLGTKAENKDKFVFDPDRKKRRAFYKEVCNLFNDYEVFIGGSSSFDMAPKGFNKALALSEYLKENGISHDQVVYVGDDYGIGGNDESVYLSDIPFIKIDDFLDFPKAVKNLLK
ncbi:MAG: iron-containing alcohol dehydrogenase [Clostridiales bacterium]|nr:iron-containing alcohol dehydrogenase [Clostridiales bacterium]